LRGELLRANRNNGNSDSVNEDEDEF
jgi:hypothetical protein